MARPLKQGLDYFSLDVHMDDSVELIEAEFGIQGFAILIKLWQKIYANGYYLEWNKDVLLLFCRRNVVEETLVSSVVNRCFLRSLFSKELYDKYNILTSVGIQKRYIKACLDSKRKDYKIKNEYSLISVNQNFNNIELTPELTQLTPELTQLTTEESTQRKGKERKGKEKKGKERKGKEKKGKENKIKEVEPSVQYQKVIDLFNNHCKSLPKVQQLTDKRKKAIAENWNDIKQNSRDAPLQVYEKVFEKIEKSNFLKGNNTKNWVCTFDWVISNNNNYVKILEGNYDNRINFDRGYISQLTNEERKIINQGITRV